MKRIPLLESQGGYVRADRHPETENTRPTYEGLQARVADLEDQLLAANARAEVAEQELAQARRRKGVRRA